MAVVRKHRRVMKLCTLTMLRMVCLCVSVFRKHRHVMQLCTLPMVRVEVVNGSKSNGAKKACQMIIKLEDNT